MFQLQKYRKKIEYVVYETLATSYPHFSKELKYIDF
jgi:hypothetical protein